MSWGSWRSGCIRYVSRAGHGVVGVLVYLLGMYIGQVMGVVEVWVYLLGMYLGQVIGVVEDLVY